jgi:hypothetical protein
VYSIREAATQNLQQLAQEFGSDWAKEHLVPQVSRGNAAPSCVAFLLRCTACLQRVAMGVECPHLIGLTCLGRASQNAICIPDATVRFYLFRCLL